MSVSESVRNRYEQDLPSLRAAFTYIKPTLAKWCSTHEYDLNGRVKSLESVSEKLETGRFRKWGALDDLVAFTIVIPTAAHEDQVLKMLSNGFRTESVRSRGTTRKPPEVFRFDSTRWYGRVRTDPVPPLDGRGRNLVFEVQIKTVFEHAWSQVTHDLVYKGGAVDWREKRLAAQLKAQVEQIELLVGQFAASASVITASRDSATDAQSELARAFKRLAVDGLIPEPVQPTSWQRFSEAVYGLVRQTARRAQDAEARTETLIQGFDAKVRSGDFEIATSGSLFQAVVAYLSAESPEWFDGFAIVPSGELKTIYRVDTPGVAIDLHS